MADASVDLPGSEDVVLGKNVLDLFQSASRCLRETEEKVDERRKIEDAEDEVGLIGNSRQSRGYGPSQSEAEQPLFQRTDQLGLEDVLCEILNSPVCCCRDGYSFSPHTHGENLGRIGPGDRADGDGEAADAQVRAHDNSFRDGTVTSYDPNG